MQPESRAAEIERLKENLAKEKDRANAAEIAMKHSKEDLVHGKNLTQAVMKSYEIGKE